jgi:electron transport complex protein RnfC
MSALLSFKSGVHPPDEKQITAGIPSRRLPFPEELVLPLSQHLGAPAKARVEIGDRVERGDLLAEASGFISAPVHATAAGTVKDIGLYPHPNGGSAEAICIQVDPHSTQLPRPRMVPRWEDLAPEEISEAIREAGVVGLGGAAFPSFVKLNPPKDQPIEVLLINGCECEPYLTSDHRVMVERAEHVHRGIRILLKGLGITKAVVGIEANKPDAIEAMQKAVPDDLDVRIQPLQVKYPQGAEKMLIMAVTGREVPSGALPSAIGAVVQNVATVSMISEVFESGLPLIERIVTVTGRGVKKTLRA